MAGLELLFFYYSLFCARTDWCNLGPKVAASPTPTNANRAAVEQCRQLFAAWDEATTKVFVPEYSIQLCPFLIRMLTIGKLFCYVRVYLV